MVFGDADTWRELASRVSARDDLALCLVTAVALSGEDGGAWWVDPDGAVAASYGVAGGTVTAVVLDANLRVLGVVDGDRLADRLVALLDTALDREPAVTVTGQAPVLLLPRALDAAYRERLIGVWESGSVATGVARQSGDVLDVDYKLRRDHTVNDPEMLRDLVTTVGRRVLPEVEKAFAFRATRFEGFKIACYDASTGGFFRAHRDNLSAATAHRVFALTLNLNDDYEGGELRFPEYGNQLYRPAAGAALVFSSAHLHEVMDITVGRRFVLLSFLYGDTPR